MHGIVHETIQFVYRIIFNEMNSATDNPMIFANADRVDIETLSPARLSQMDAESEGLQEKRKRLLCGEYNVTQAEEHERYAGHADYECHEGVIISGGNFHGEYPAKALDYLAIGIHEIASISERRIERLVNPQLSGLPAFLTPHGGLNRYG